VTLQALIDAAPGDSPVPVVIRVPAGVYHEKLTVSKPNLWLVGDEAATTVLTFDDHATKLHPDGTTYGTFATATLLVTGEGFHAEGLTIENAAGPGEKVGQALAVYVDAPQTEFVNCRLVGHQDTLFIAPLPPYPLTVPTFGGPRETAPRTVGRHRFTDCLIRGDVDFIFGSGEAEFVDCEIFSTRREEGAVGWVTAASTPEGAPRGFVFRHCRFTGDALPGTVYLGRPWRNFARTELFDCWLGAHIHPEGWHDWDKPEARATVHYAESGSFGPGSSPATRAAWCRSVSPQAVS